MKVTQEVVTVVPDPLAGEVHIVLAGLKISLLPEEAEHLAQGLAAGLERLKAMGGPAAEGWTVRRAGPEAEVRAPEARADEETMQLRTRALVQAMMREKGLALRPEDGT